MKTTQHKKTDLFGKEYTEVRDESGNYLGRSENKKDLFGKEYVEHFDKDGNSLGQSELKEGVFGDEYIKHIDSDGHSIGTSHKRNTVVGDKIVHENVDGETVGNSVEDNGYIHGQHTQHDGGSSIHHRADQLLADENSSRPTESETLKSTTSNHGFDMSSVQDSPIMMYLLGKLGIGLAIGIVLAIMTGEFFSSLVAGIILAFVGKFLLKFFIKDLSSMGK